MPAERGLRDGDPAWLGVRERRDDRRERSKELRGAGERGRGFAIDNGNAPGDRG